MTKGTPGAVLLLSLLMSASAAAGGEADAAEVSAATLGVVVNDADELSRQIAAEYMGRRGIPAANLIHLSFEPGRPQLSRAEFGAIQSLLDNGAGPQIQAYALTWMRPYQVGCMSITMAFAAGFDTKWCAEGCKPTERSRYFDSPTRAPWNELHLRPAMMLAARDFDAARALIDRGIAADGTAPAGTAYLVETSDPHRNSRAFDWPATVGLFEGRFQVELVHAEQIEDRTDVMFYFIGAMRVAALDSLRFLPGAAADHLTSAGGRLDGDKQMSSLEWLEAGATGSYGTVVEPCNFPGKFPDPAVLMRHYLAGETLIEAYWKSVAMPGQGVFIGEPLARPFAGRPGDKLPGSDPL